MPQEGAQAPRLAAALLLSCAALALAVPAASAQELPDASCPGPPNSAVTPDANDRRAQTFTAQRTGSLTRAEVEVSEPAATTGDWVVQIAPVDIGGSPTNTVLATETIADATVPTGNAYLTAVFSPPAAVWAGFQYALVVTRPAPFGIRDRIDNPCPGAEFHSDSLTGPWIVVDPPEERVDFVFYTYVVPGPVADPPPTAETGLRAAALKKCKKKKTKKARKKCRKKALKLPL